MFTIKWWANGLRCETVYVENEGTLRDKVAAAAKQVMGIGSFEELETRIDAAMDGCLTVELLGVGENVSVPIYHHKMRKHLSFRDVRWSENLDKAEEFVNEYPEVETRNDFLLVYCRLL